MSVQKQKGFTVVEMIIVIVIVGILAAISLVGYTSAQQKARDNTRTSDIMEVQKALEKYRAANGVYPSVGTDGSPYALTTLGSALVPQYIRSIPVAPSGTAYQYVRGTPSADSYGIRIDYEARTDCHRGINNNGATWWSLPACI